MSALISATWTVSGNSVTSRQDRTAEAVGCWLRAARWYRPAQHGRIHLGPRSLEVPVLGLFLMAPPRSCAATPSRLEAAPVPTCIIHGWHDELIPAEAVVDWAQARSDHLVLVDDSHRLAAHVDLCAAESPASCKDFREVSSPAPESRIPAGRRVACAWRYPRDRRDRRRQRRRPTRSSPIGRRCFPDWPAVSCGRWRSSIARTSRTSTRACTR